MATIAAHAQTVLKAGDHHAFFAALDAPAEPTDKLKEAFRSHRSRVRSR